MNPFEFVIAIIIITGIFSVIKYRMKLREGGAGEAPQLSRDKEQLLSEVRELKERIKVLERITVDKENSLSREIDSLRDR